MAAKIGPATFARLIISLSGASIGKPSRKRKILPVAIFLQMPKKETNKIKKMKLPASAAKRVGRNAFRPTVRFAANP